MLHSSIFYLYVCKANNNVKEGRGFRNIPENNSPKQKSTSRENKENRKTKIRKQEKVFGKQKTETKLKAMEQRNNAQKTEIMKPVWFHDFIGKWGKRSIKI